MKHRRKAISISLGIMFAAAIWFGVWHIQRPRMIARAVAPDGTEFCVVQTFNWNFELFTTSCYYRKPGGQWGWLYYDHEDVYWRSASVQLDPAAKRLSIHRDGQVTATFDWGAEKYRLLRPDHAKSESTGPGHLMPVGWKPAES